MRQGCDESSSTNPESTLCVSQGIMTYTRRVIGLELKSSQPWAQWGGASTSTHAATSVAGVLAATETPRQGVLPVFSVPAGTPVKVCTQAMQAGALLLLDVNSTPDLPAAELHGYCASLREAGFSVGIGDYRGEAVWTQSIPLLSHIRVRYSAQLLPKQKELLGSSLRRQVCFVADGVNTNAQLKDAIAAGFQLFQGAFAYRIPRLQWPDEEFKVRTLLLEKACSHKTIDAETIDDFNSCSNLFPRLESLLRSVNPVAPHVLNDSGLLLAELGDARMKQAIQICMVQDLVGQAPPMLLARIFHLARFHELMRAAALGRPAPSALFEGLLLSSFAAVERKGQGDSEDRHTSSLLKQNAGMPMDCSAFDRNHSIADAYFRADWSAAERLCVADGFSVETLCRIHRQSAAWARETVTLPAQPLAALAA